MKRSRLTELSDQRTIHRLYTHTTLKPTNYPKSSCHWSRLSSTSVKIQQLIMVISWKYFTCTCCFVDPLVFLSTVALITSICITTQCCCIVTRVSICGTFVNIWIVIVKRWLDPPNSTNDTKFETRSPTRLDPSISLALVWLTKHWMYNNVIWGAIINWYSTLNIMGISNPLELSPCKCKYWVSTVN